MATRTKANNTTALDQVGSWVEGIVPTSADDIIWGFSVTASIGGGIACKSLEFTVVGGTGGISANGASALAVHGATLTFTEGTFTIECPVALNANLLLSGTITGTGIINGVVSGAYTVNKASESNVSFLGLNTYTGKTTITQGRLTINTIKDVSGGASSLGAPTTTANGTIDLGARFAGKLEYVGSGNSSTNRVINITGVAGYTTYIEQDGSGNLEFTSDLTEADGAKTLHLRGTGVGIGKISGVISDTASGAISLVKSESCVWESSASNTMTGTVTISAGTLRVTGTFTSSSATFSVTGTLSGSGTIAGAITVNNGGTIAPGSAGDATETLATAAVTFNTTSIYSVHLDGVTPSFDRINSSGTVALGSATNTLTVAGYTNSFSGKVFTIIEASTLTGTFNGKAEGSMFIVSGRILQISYLNNKVTLTDVTPDSGDHVIGRGIMRGVGVGIM